MPHCTVTLAEELLDGTVEQPLVDGLTDAVVSVYGDWARPLVVIALHGVPTARFAVGGELGAAPPPDVLLHSRAGLFTRMPDAAERLAAALTDAVAAALGEATRENTTVHLVGVPDDRSAVGGVLVSAAA
ncbi:Phenylpyruvate tautomerase PptA, 4-oxalocrotonate tautomerase family [Streptomyces zhaozhouensis]|uniref:Phenylpyruvate tautomerase PptA, 4-oxalocrotonate tautomerase family n=1 Tax=Streptomyces zhaozhouensis TaxID=1300267 RepID=A0A286DP21_9ACTN|nr:tautomerase family protein [Streptomyces zhaozhouensis]SOD60353.1 Phenylpyruvate tautomerase PptA, 4-oxalocrotonate tautomerase family [Streptomyces zhaozhouensis]